MEKIQSNSNVLSIKREMQLNIQGCNKILTPEVTENYELVHLLRLIHPLDRERFARKLYAQKLITKEESLEFIKID